MDLKILENIFFLPNNCNCIRYNYLINADVSQKRLFDLKTHQINAFIEINYF
jgi:hypothetical protein